MKLYDYDAPSPRRVRIYLAEKGLDDIPKVSVDLRHGEQFDDGFEARNPYRQLPVLELDDGTVICESMAICRYFEELHPQPPLFGFDPKDCALTEMWNRRVELWGYLQVVDIARNTMPGFADRGLAGFSAGVAQIPQLAERATMVLRRLYQILDEQLAQTEFIVGANFSVADITALVMVEFAANWVKLPYGEDRRSLRRWHETVAARPSTSV